MACLQLHKGRILLTKKIMKKFVKLCLHSSYTAQNSFHFDEIFHRKFNNFQILFFDRRCQAYESLNQVDSAYKDAREVHRVDPKNNAIEPVLVRLHKAVSEKVHHNPL